MKTHIPLKGKCQVFAGNASGLTLPELTLTIFVVIGLIAVLFMGSAIYASQAKRSGCLMAQDQVLKAVIADANLKVRTLVPDVDYYAKAVEDGVLEPQMVCPETGVAYRVEVERINGKLKIICPGCGAVYE